MFQNITIKKTRLTCLFLLIGWPFYHSIAQGDSNSFKPFYTKGGLSLILAGAKTSEDFTLVPSVTIAPGWRMVRAKEFSVSLEAPVSVGLSSNDNHVFIGVELPATINLNFGCNASDKSASNVGWSFGIGKGFHYSYNEYYNNFDSDENDELSIWGTLFQTSLIIKKTAIRLHWLSNFSSQPVRKDAIGIGILVQLD